MSIFVRYLLKHSVFMMKVLHLGWNGSLNLVWCFGAEMYYAPGITSIIAHHFTYWDSIRARGSHLSIVTRKPLSTDRNHVSRGKVSNFQNAYFYAKWQIVTLSPTHHHVGDDTKSNQMLSQHFNPERPARNSTAECFPATKWLGNTRAAMNSKLWTKPPGHA